MDQSTAIILQSFVGMHAAPAPWLTSPPASLPKRLQTRSILQRMNHAVEGKLVLLSFKPILSSNSSAQALPLALIGLCLQMPLKASAAVSWQRALQVCAA